MSTKQLARTVSEGRKVTFMTNLGTVEGYLCGIDDYHWLVITSDRRPSLIHKSAPLIHLAVESTFSEEPEYEFLEKVVGPFRRKLEEDGQVRPLPRRADQRVSA